MTRDQQLLVKSSYHMLFEGDKPPYPARGLKELFITFHKALAL